MINLCLVIDSNSINKWQCIFINNLAACKEVSIKSVLITNDFYVSRSLSWNFYQVLTRNRKNQKFRALPKCIEKIPSYKVKSEDNKLDIDQYELISFFDSYPVDVVLNLSNALLIQSSGVKNNFEIWQFCNFSLFQGNFIPQVFQSIINQDNYIKVSINRLNSKGYASVLNEARFKVYQFSYTRTCKLIIKDLHVLIVRETKKIESGIERDLEKRIPLESPSLKYPSFTNLLRLVFIETKSFLKHLYERGFHVDHWNVGYLEKPINEVLYDFSSHPVHWFQSSKKRFIADSFAVENEGKKYIFFEGLDYNEGKGYLSVATLKEDKLIEEKLILKEPFHLSYPFVFKYENDFYCIPETNEAGSIMLYKSISFPEKWQKVKVLIPGIKGIDTTVFQKDDKWWMFFSKKDDGPYHKLFLFYSESLMGEWKEHLLNPVKVDITATRGAGPVFEIDNKLYRPAQDYSRKIEGSIRMNEIVKLTPTEFLEREVCELKPFVQSSFPHKVHTIASLGNWTIVDGARQINILSNPTIAYFKIKRLARQILKNVI